MPTEQDITTRRGATRQIVHNAQKDDVNHSLVGAVAGAIRFRIGTRANPSLVEHLYDPADGSAPLQITDAATGEITITTQDDDTDLPPLDYDWEVWVKHGDLDDATIYGTWTIEYSPDGAA